MTASTVGYGDLVPQSAAGQIVAGMLMFAGIGLVGLVSGSLASWFVDRVGIQGTEADRSEVAELSERLAVLETQIAEIHAVLVDDGKAEVVEQPDRRH